MDAEAKLSILTFINDVALFGARISHVFHNYASLERQVDRRLPSRLGHLNATVQTLGRLAELIKGETNESCALDDQAFKYVETLADECAITMGRMTWIITGDRAWRNVHAPRYWKSITVVNSKGQKELLKPEIDELAIYQGLKASKRNGKLGQIGGTSNRFEELQLHLLLVVQVITMHNMTKTLPSGIDELRNFVEHQSRICRAAKLAGLCDRDGKILKKKSRTIYITSSSSSGSDSEVEISTRRPPPPLRSRSKPFKAPPPPPPLPPPVWIRPSVGQVHRGPPPPPPPGWFGSAATFPPKVAVPTSSESVLKGNMPLPTGASPSSSAGLGPLPTSRVVAVEELGIEHQPPSYTEKEGVTISRGSGVEAVPFPNNDPKDSKCSDAKGPDQAEPKGSLKTSMVSKSVEPPTDDNARIPSPKSSSFGMKFKNLFRTKASLETEMKRTLADANASLAAFVIQEGESTKVPHSAFHSLEYTHMRTILSQLKDNTWFKTFSDLTQAEHRTLGAILCKNRQEGKWMERELVVLKVLQQNRFNAWMRVIEECIGTEEFGFGYRYENGRIILAIVREKECDNVMAVVPLVPPMSSIPPPPRVIDLSDQLPAAPVPNLLPIMPRDGKIISDLSKSGTLTVWQNGVAPACGHGRSPPGYRGPPPPNSSRREFSPRPFPEGPLASDPGSRVKPLKAVSEHAARRALTSYTAFTFRPAPPENTTRTPLVHIPPITWARCSLAREHETKADLLKRIDQFKQRGVSIIDMKLRLKEDQSAQVTRLVEELNYIEEDERYEHTLVELSMIEVANGSVKKPTPGVYIDVIHVVVQRAPKDSVRCADTYDRIMNSPSPPPGIRPFEGTEPFPSNGPRQPPDEVVIIQDAPLRTKGKKGRKSVASSVTYSSSSSGSDSDSDSYSSSGSGDYERNRRRRYGSDSSCSDSSSDEDEGNLNKRRWKVDPIEIKFNKNEKGRDVAKVLLERWTIDGKTKDGKEKAKGNDGKENNKEKN